MSCLSDPNDAELPLFSKSSNPRNKSENPMVQLFYGTFLTEGIREGKSPPLDVSVLDLGPTISVLLCPSWPPCPARPLGTQYKEKAGESEKSTSEHWFCLLKCV